MTQTQQKTFNSLAEELQDYIEQAQKTMPAETTDIFLRSIAKLVEDKAAARALKLGNTIPEFNLPNATGKEISSKKLLEKGPLVILFYRGAWCPFCNLELRAIQKRLDEIKALGAEVIAISPQIPDNSLNMQEKNNLGFEVLSDRGNAVAKKFGIVFKLDPEASQLYERALQVKLKDYNGDDSEQLPMPASYVVDQDGIIKFAFVDPDYTKRAEPNDIIAALKQLKS